MEIIITSLHHRAIKYTTEEVEICLKRPDLEIVKFSIAISRGSKLVQRYTGRNIKLNAVTPRSELHISLHSFPPTKTPYECDYQVGFVQSIMYIKVQQYCTLPYKFMINL
jgi:hypothetical protein